MGPSIDALAQSQDGYLWCRTRSGLFRFDDVKFTRFSNRVQRAMDVRLVLRQGLRYALARNGIRVLQILLTVVVVSTAATLLAGDHTDRPQKIIAMGVGLAVVFLLRRGADARLGRSPLLPRRYNAEQILSDLGDQVRTMVETRPLLETVAGRIAESLHVPRVAVLLDGGNPYRLAYTIGYDPAPDVVFHGDGATVEWLRKEREPARVHFQDPNSWIYREPAMTKEERIKLAALETEWLLPLAVKDKSLECKRAWTSGRSP